MRLMIYVFFVVLVSVALAKVEVIKSEKVEKKKATEVEKPRKVEDAAAKPHAKKAVAKLAAKKAPAAKPSSAKKAEPAVKTEAGVPDFDIRQSVTSFSSVVDNLSSIPIMFQCSHICNKKKNCVKECMEIMIFP